MTGTCIKMVIFHGMVMEFFWWNPGLVESFGMVVNNLLGG